MEEEINEGNVRGLPQKTRCLPAKPIVARIIDRFQGRLSTLVMAVMEDGP
jgi:hypothetical protein